MIKITLIASVATLAFSAPASASPCKALGEFYLGVMAALQTEVDRDTLKNHVQAIHADRGACAETVALMRETGAYSDRVRFPDNLLREQLTRGASFAVRVVGKGDQIDGIKFDISEVGVLRRRPTR